MKGENVCEMYEPKEAWATPDKDRDRLERCSDAGSACRLWKRTLRETLARSIVSSEPGRSTVKDVYEH
jgi:hypothetical protein